MHKCSITILGLGYVGLPTACILANCGYSVLGVDIDQDVIDNIKSSYCLSLEPELQDLLDKVISNDCIQFSTNIIPSEIYIIASEFH